MTVWRYGISWSKFKMASECPHQLLQAVKKTPYGEARPNYYMNLGTVVQKVFELYFNQGINLKEGGRTQEVLFKCAQKVVNSKWVAELGITYPPGKDEESLRSEVVAHVMGGFLQFQELGLLDKRLRAEVDWGSTFRNLRLFGRMDFVYDTPEGVYIYDGKGHKEKTADERQLIFYSLVANASGKKVLGAGFLYWQLGFVSVDVSLPKIQAFIESDFNEASEYFHMLKTGVEFLPAKPESNRCWLCNWCRVCEFSARKMLPVDTQVPESVEF